MHDSLQRILYAFVSQLTVMRRPTVHRAYVTYRLYKLPTFTALARRSYPIGIILKVVDSKRFSQKLAEILALI